MGIMLFLVLSLVGLSSCTGFLTDSHTCEASAPCSCPDDHSHNHQFIDCAGYSLTAMPRFHNASGSQRDMTIDLSNNAITILKTYAFQHLNHSHLNTLSVDLHSNKIANIANDAFLGYEGSLTWLNLANNNLASVPTALRNLTGIQTLDIRNNSIVTFDRHTMTQLGKVLNTLSFGYHSMAYWPSELHYLRSLQTLNVYYTALQALPTDAFQGLSQTLKTLRIDSTNIGTLVVAICYLKHIENFYFDNNVYHHGHKSIFEPCLSPLTSLKVLHLDNNNFQYFPPVFNLFPNITTLYVINNPALFYVDDSLIPENTVLTDLYLFNNRLTRVPEAIQKMQLLKTLDLHGNQIKLIETHDVTDMDSLQTLRLDGNPIKFISSMAFQNLPQLHNLFINGSDITIFPQAISKVTALQNLYLPTDQIECTCDLSYLKTWHVRANLRGTCEASTEKIGDFVRGGIHGCPDRFVSIQQSAYTCSGSRAENAALKDS